MGEFLIATRTYIETELICKPRTAIPNRFNNGFTISDELGKRISQNSGVGSGLTYQGQTPIISLPWLNSTSPSAESISGVVFMRFYKDNTISTGATGDTDNAFLSGYALEGRLAYLDCKMEGQESDVDGGNFDLNFKTLQGIHRIVKPPSGDGPHTCVLNCGDDRTTKIRTVGNIDANRSLRFDIYFQGQDGNGPQSGGRIAIGDKYSLVARHGLKWQLDKKVNGEWSMFHRLDKLPNCNLHGNHYFIDFQRIAGYGVIAINGQAFWFAEVTEQPGKKPKTEEVNWPAAPLFFNTYNCRMRIGVALMKYADPNDSVFTGTFTRTFSRITRVTEEMLTSVRLQGWSAAGTQATGSATVQPTAVTYTVNLTASPHGIDTPFIKTVIVRSRSQWQYPDISGIDVARAVSSWTLDEAMPPIQAGATLSIDLNRILLDGIASDWDTFLRKDCPITLRTRDHFDDNTVSSWEEKFAGYITDDHRQTEGYNDETLGLSARDPIHRLTEKNAIIDYRMPPLDVLFFDKLDSDGDGAVIYDSDCVIEILRHFIGPDEADVINGNGDGNRYFTEPIPLLDTATGAGFIQLNAVLTSTPPTSGVFYFPPKMLSDAISWINDFATAASAIFFYGKPAGYSGWPVPMYGHISNFLAGRPTHVVKGKVVDEGDQNSLVQSMDNEKRQERDINRVLVVGVPASGVEAEITPSRFIGDARLPADDPNAPETSWEKTYVVHAPLLSYSLEPLTQYAADFIIASFAGVEIENPHLQYLYSATHHWGDLLEAEVIGDDKIGIMGKTWRIGKITHAVSYDENGSHGITTASLAPLNNFGL